MIGRARDRLAVLLGLAVLVCCQASPLYAQSEGAVERPAAAQTSPTSLANQAPRWVRLVKSTTLNAIARGHFPADRPARDLYRATIVAANPQQFPNADNAGSVLLPAGTALLFPPGASLPSSYVANPSEPPAPAELRAGAQSVAPALGAVALAAAQRKIKTCVPRIDQTAKALAAGANSGAFLFNSLSDADKTILSLSLEVGDGASSSYASATFAPLGAQGCAVAADVVAWWPANCAEVMTKAFPQVTAAGPLMRDIRVTEAGPTMRVFFMPAGAGCVTIKKEVIF